jgi:hypothetical protein
MDRPENIDRGLLGLCAVVWLAVIGVGVAATVALVGLGSGNAGEPQSDAHTPWVLYAVIGISALVIVASIPLLLRARRASQVEPPARGPAVPPRPPAPPRRAVAEPATEKLRVFGTTADPSSGGRPGDRRQDPRPRVLGGPSTEFVDRVWLRFITSIAIAAGVATLGVTVAAYMFADHSDDLAWAALVVAGIVTAAMPAVPWWHLRRLGAGVS